MGGGRVGGFIARAGGGVIVSVRCGVCAFGCAWSRFIFEVREGTCGSTERRVGMRVQISISMNMIFSVRMCKVPVNVFW